MLEEDCDGVEARNELVVKSYSFSENCTGSMFVSFLRVLLDFETNDRVRLHWRKINGRREAQRKHLDISSTLSERRIVGTLISALPDQLKSILTEAEVEQFASRIYSSLVSDGIIGSITIDGVARNKDFAVTIRSISPNLHRLLRLTLNQTPTFTRFQEDSCEYGDSTPSVSLGLTSDRVSGNGRRDSEKELLKQELERLREFAKNAGRSSTQGKSTQTSPSATLPDPLPSSPAAHDAASKDPATATRGPPLGLSLIHI